MFIVVRSRRGELTAELERRFKVFGGGHGTISSNLVMWAKGGRLLEQRSWLLRLAGRGKGGGAACAAPLQLLFPSARWRARGPASGGLVGLDAHVRRAGVLAGARQ